MPAVDFMIDTFRIEEVIDSFLQLVLAQNIYALRTCSFSIENKRERTPCILVSTLFIRPLRNSRSVFNVYRLIPFPIFTKDEKYIYSNLPAFVGINTVDDTIALWTRTANQQTCSFLMVVQCDEEPLIVPLSTIPCLQELFGKQVPTTSTCHVTRSQEVQPSILHVGGGLWLFYNTDQPYQCQAVMNSTENIRITAPGQYRIPCELQIQCSIIELPSVSCITETIVVRPTTGNIYKQISAAGLSLNNLTHRLVRTYSKNAIAALTSLEKQSLQQKSTFKRILLEFGNWALSVLLLLSLTIILIVVKILRARINRQIDATQKNINKLIRDFGD